MTEDQLMVRRAMQEALDRRDNGGPPPATLRGPGDGARDDRRDDDARGRLAEGIDEADPEGVRDGAGAARSVRRPRAAA